MVTWFNRLRDWTTDQANGIGIRADYHDQEDDNFAEGINLSLNIAGGNSPTANIPMGGFKFTGMGNGSLAADSATLAQVQTRVVAYAADSVGTDAYAITLSPALAAYAVGQSFYFAAGTVNTGAATLNINGLGAKAIKKDYNVDLADGDIAQNKINHVIYDGTNFQLLSPPQGLMNQSMSPIYAADGGGSDSYSITLSPALSSYANGQLINFKANTKNTGAASLNVNGLGAKTIKKDQGADLADGDIAANQIIQVIYDGTNFQMLSPIFGCVSQNGASIYAADAGVTDAYAITLSPAPTAYTTGMVIRFKANTANTGAATLAVNGLSAITIVKNGNVTLADGDIKANQIIDVVYDGANFQMLSAHQVTIATAGLATGSIVSGAGTITVTAAVQADMETATSTAVAVVPGVVQFHPSASKFWLVCTDSGGTTYTILASYNITSITDGAAGLYTVTIATDMSSANYPIVTGGNETSGAATSVFVQYHTVAAGSFIAYTANSAGSATDIFLSSHVGYGDQ